MHVKCFDCLGKVLLMILIVINCVDSKVPIIMKGLSIERTLRGPMYAPTLHSSTVSEGQATQCWWVGSNYKEREGGRLKGW